MHAALPREVRPVVTFAYHTGCRKREMLGLTWNGITLQAKMVRLDSGSTKNRHGRLLYLDGELSETLTHLTREHDLLYPHCLWVFHRQGTPLKDVRAVWASAG